MIRLTEPNYTFEQTLELCLNGITGNQDFHQRLSNAGAQLLLCRDNYQLLASQGRLFATSPLITGGNPQVVPGISKSEFVTLYGSYFRSSNKPAREVYDSLILAANEKCPYCGGIGRPRNLDHYLPKANYPQYSVLPWNLVPACRDCNMEDKSTAYAQEAGEQIIQPYLDDNCFFDMQWIRANFIPTNNGQPASFNYFVDTPNEWDETQKQRCRKHFEEFQLAKRYSIQAASDLIYVEDDWFNAQQNKAHREMFIGNCQKVIERSPFINHWKRIMYQALINTF